MPRERLDRPRWARVDALLDELLDLEPSARDEALELAEESDRWTADRARELLRAMKDTRDDLFAVPLGAAFPDLVPGALAEAVEDRSGKLLGAYRLLRILGRGGMGVVYLAERADREFEKRVAIKLMPSGLESDEAERRFRIERQVLARLEHPGIARLLDGGVTEEGYPYLVMELVEGLPIDRYCDRTELASGDRIRLFLEVCEAVQYAHQNLVIHRDLKPANILVDADGSVKLLDFGVAKLLEEDATAPATRFQPHTPAFAAPEQLANRPVSTASDTYSLGLVLQRLLSGESSESSPQADARANEPARSGSENGRTATDGRSRSRGRRLGADLGRVLDKSLRVEPERRYPTAAALADDLRRYLAGEPVSARESTLGYRLRRFVGRHRAGVALAVAALSLLTAMLAITVWQGARAREEAIRSQRIAGLLTGLFVDADPWAPTSGEVTVPELLDRGVSRVREQLADDRETRASLLSVLGRAFNGQGRPNRGIPLLEQVLEERRELFGEGDARTAEAMGQLGYALLAAGREEQAAPLIERSVEITESVSEPGSKVLAERLFALGLLRHDQGDFRAQEEIFSRVIGLLRRPGDEPSSALALALGQLSVAVESQGRAAESLALQRQAVATAEETLGPDHPYTANLRNNLGVRLSESGDFEAAAGHYRRALELLEERPGIRSEELVVPLSNLGRTLLEQGELQAARPHLERAATIARGEMAPDDLRRLGAEINLATLLTELGRLEEAQETYRATLDDFLTRFGPDHQATARVRSLLGANLHLALRPGEAERELTAALAVQRALDHDPRGLDETLLSLGRLRLDQRRYDEARGLLEEALAYRARKLPASHWRIAEVEIEVVALRRGSGEPAAESATSPLRRIEGAVPAENYRLRRARRLLYP